MNDIPAFPRTFTQFSDENGHWSCEGDGQIGMTLRDYFAAKAMQCFLSGSNLYEFDEGMADIIAAKSSIMARSMLKARQEKEGK